MGETAVWQALPSDEHPSVWDDTERKFQERFRRDVHELRANLTAQFHHDTQKVRDDLGRLTTVRTELNDRRMRLARELAMVDADIAQASHNCNDRANRLAAMEYDFRKNLHSTLREREEVSNSMTNFFREKRGEEPLPTRQRPDGAEKKGRSEVDASGVPTPTLSTSSDSFLVNIVDADGRVVGPIERIEPWNQWVEAIQDLPVQRPVVIRRGRRFNQDHLNSIYERAEAKGVKWLSCMIQAIGEVQTRRCQSCEKNQGAFENCVIVGGEMFPKCGNCEWNRQGCHGASAEWIDMQAAQEHARQKKHAAPPTPTEKDTPPSQDKTSASREISLPPFGERAREIREAAERLAHEEVARQMRLKDSHQHTPSYGPRIEPRPRAGLTPPPQSVEDQRIAQIALARLAALPNELPQTNGRQLPRLPSILREPSAFVDPIRHMNSNEPSNRELPPPRSHVFSQHDHDRRPLPKEPRSFTTFTAANLRSRPSSSELASAPLSTSSSPQQTHYAVEEPLTEITSKNLVLRHDGNVYTHPECMAGVPVGKIDENHPYWEPHWKDVKSDITEQWEKWKAKHSNTVVAEARGEKNGSSKYQIGRQVNRGAKILEFLEKGEISPYQLLAKRFLHTAKGGITSYDTLFRLSESLSELEKFNLDISPVAWLRQRLHEIYLAEGPNFNMPRTIHDFYHDKKLASLRAKAGFRNIGRPSGKGMGSGLGSNNGTPMGQHGKRKTMHWSAEPQQQALETTFINHSPGQPITPKFRNVIVGESHFAKRQKSGGASEKQNGATVHVNSSTTHDSIRVAPVAPRTASTTASRTASPRSEVSIPAVGSPAPRSIPGSAPGSAPPSAPASAPGTPPTSNTPLVVASTSYTSDSESVAGIPLSENDFRISQIKTPQHISSLDHSQYMHLATGGGEGQTTLEHRILTGTGASEQWQTHQSPVDFGVRLSEVDRLIYSIGALKVYVEARSAGSSTAGARSSPRDVMVSFKRESTLLRFLSCCKDMSVDTTEVPT